MPDTGTGNITGAEVNLSIKAAGIHGRCRPSFGQQRKLKRGAPAHSQNTQIDDLDRCGFIGMVKFLPVRLMERPGEVPGIHFFKFGQRDHQLIALSDVTHVQNRRNPALLGTDTIIGKQLVSLLQQGPVQEQLFSIQHDLFDIGAELCQPETQLITEDYVDGLESSIEELNERLPALKEFILPGGTPAVASLQLARTVCRRAERALVELAAQEELNPVTCRYMNRLSDLLFVLGRSQAREDGSGEVYWNSQYSRLQRGD